jgi:hypothetical protein
VPPAKTVEIIDLVSDDDSDSDPAAAAAATTESGGSGEAHTPSSSGQARGSGAPSWKTWQSDEDMPQRRLLMQHMYVVAE